MGKSRSICRDEDDRDSGHSVVGQVDQHVKSGPIGRLCKCLLKQTHNGGDDDQSVPQETALCQNNQWLTQDDLLLKIMSYVAANVSDVMRLTRVSKRWKKLSECIIEENFQPQKEFKSYSELKRAVATYCRKRYTYDKKDVDSDGKTYGYPIGKWKVSRIECFASLFADQKCFNGDISNWDVSNARDMRCMFSGASAFNQPLNKWNVSNVTSMCSMFFGAHSFNQDIGKWNVSSVTDMESMFAFAVTFNQDIQRWNVGNVKCMKNMFMHAQAFNQCIEDWDVSHVKDYDGVVAHASSFQKHQLLPALWYPGLASNNWCYIVKVSHDSVKS